MIASWMAYLLIVGAVAFLVAHLLESFLAAGRWPRRWAWTGALASSLLVPVAVGLGAGRSAAPVQLEHLPATEARPPATVATLESGAATGSWRRRALDPWNRPLVVVWLGASLLLAIRFGLGAWRNQRLRFRAAPTLIDGQPARQTASAGPSVVGLFRPEIVVPEWIAALAPADRRLVLAHERAHIMSRDPLLLTAADLAVVVAPWNPALWLQRARLRRAVELDCDARVLNTHPDPDRYGRLLLTVGDRLLNRSPVPAFARSRSSLAERIDAITKEQPPMTLRRILTLAAGAGLAVFAGCTAPLPEPFAQSEAPPATQTAGPDIARAAVAAYVEGLAARPAGDDMTVLAVFDRDGKHVVEQRTKALSMMGQLAGTPILGGLSPDEIGSVEVLKGGRHGRAIIIVLRDQVPDAAAWLATRMPAGTVQARPATPSRDIVLAIDGPRLAINNQPVAPADLGRELAAIFDDRPEKRLVVVNTPATPKERVAAVVAEVRAAGVTAVLQPGGTLRLRATPR